MQHDTLRPARFSDDPARAYTGGASRSLTCWSGLPRGGLVVEGIAETDPHAGQVVLWLEWRATADEDGQYCFAVAL
jgi:hypothetical protein